MGHVTQQRKFRENAGFDRAQGVVRSLLYVRTGETAMITDVYYGAHIVDSRVFRLLVDLEVQKAQRLHYCLAVVCLTADLLPGAGMKETESAVANLVSRQLRATDVVAPYGASFVAMLLIDAEPSDLPSITSRLIDQLGAVPWSAGGSCYPHHVTMPDDMLRQAVDFMVHARDAGGCRLVAHG